jgi:hypothetical protein
MKRKTHNRIVKTLFPWIAYVITDAVNRTIDTPKPWMPNADPRLGKFPGLVYKGHRKKGHDLVTAAVLGFLKGRLDGLIVAVAHLGADAVRDGIRSRWGTEIADIMEDSINLAHVMNEKRKLEKREKKGTRKRLNA